MGEEGLTKVPDPRPGLDHLRTAHGWRVACLRGGASASDNHSTQQLVISGSPVSPPLPPACYITL